MDGHIIVYCTVPSLEVGKKIADDLVKGRFAACVNIIPGITSVYRWKGEVCTDNELQLIIKSRKALFPEIQERIRALHPYELPEIISCELSDGSEPYLKWISDSTLPSRS